jgi:two-component system sensor histidine kinase/response regulator
VSVDTALAPANDVSAFSALHAIAGLDVSKGLHFMGGARQTYLRLLRRFASHEADAVTRMRQALASAQPMLAMRIAHTLKGLAGNLGASLLAQAADALESGLRNSIPSDEAHAQLRALEDRLLPLIQVLNEVLPGESPELPASADITQVAAVLDRLAFLLGESDGEASDYFETYRELLSRQIGVEVVTVMQQQVASYAFDEAALTLRAALAARESEG